MGNREYPSIIFEERMKSIKRELKNFCKETVDVYRKAINLIEDYNNEEADDVFKRTKQLDIQGYEIEKSCIRFMAVEQPVAGDLMYIESAIRIISHIKRIAYLCNNITNSSKELKDVEIPQKLSDNLGYMADYVQIMLTSGFGAFYNQDLVVAKELPEDDDKVDELFDKILSQVTSTISEKTEDAIAMINIIFIAKYLERIADRVVNIGDRVIFINTNKRPHIENLKQDG